MAKTILRVTYIIKNCHRQTFENSVLYKYDKIKPTRVVIQVSTLYIIESTYYEIIESTYYEIIERKISEFQKWCSRKKSTPLEQEDVERLIETTNQHVAKIDLTQRNYEALVSSFQEKCSKKYGQTNVMRIKSAIFDNFARLDKFSTNLYS